MKHKSKAILRFSAIFLLLLTLLVSFTKGEESKEYVSDFSEAVSNTEVSEAVSNTEASEAVSNTEASEEASKADNVFEAVFCGTYGFGKDEYTADMKDTFEFIFKVNGKEELYTLDNGIKNENGTYTYDIQNTLKRGSTYMVTVENQKIVKAEEILPAISDKDKYNCVVSGVAGEKTVTNFLKTALMPVGTALYVYGGGWNWQDDGASVQSKTIGIPQTWVDFFESQKETYKYYDDEDKTNSYYPYGAWNEYYYAGLDCSGYVGWAVYNVVNTESGNEGYVMSASNMALDFANRGWGTFSKDIGSSTEELKKRLLPGDIVSKSGHVWICLGVCDDGSVVILHSTPSYSRADAPGGGVQISAVGDSEECEAYKIADEYMKTYFGKWYERYPVALKNFEEYTDFTSENTGVFSWEIGNEAFMSDPDGIRSMSARQVLQLLFKES